MSSGSATTSARARSRVGQIFLPRTDLGAQEACRTIVESRDPALRLLHLWLAPGAGRHIGDRREGQRHAARDRADHARQPQGRWTTRSSSASLPLPPPDREARSPRPTIQRFLYLLAVGAARSSTRACSSPSSSTRLLSGPEDQRFVSAVAIFHQRYSTNTFPTWRLAQPFRMLAHNGEINTLKGNVNWMKSHEIRMAAAASATHRGRLKPVIQPGGSDSAALDNMFEVLVRAGRAAPMAKTAADPRSVGRHGDEHAAAHKALYAYCNAVMEPWDGPAALCAMPTAAGWSPAWTATACARCATRITDDGLLIVGSETGMVGSPRPRSSRKGRIGPGQMIAVDLDEGRFYDEREIMDHAGRRTPLRRLGRATSSISTTCRAAAAPSRAVFDAAGAAPPPGRRRPDAGRPGAGPRSPWSRTPRKRSAPWATTRRWPCCQRPVPAAASTSSGRTSARSPTRRSTACARRRVMSLKTRFGNLGNILDEDESQCASAAAR